MLSFVCVQTFNKPSVKVVWFLHGRNTVDGIPGAHLRGQTYCKSHLLTKRKSREPQATSEISDDMYVHSWIDCTLCGNVVGRFNSTRLVTKVEQICSKIQQSEKGKNVMSPQLLAKSQHTVLLGKKEKFQEFQAFADNKNIFHSRNRYAGLVCVYSLLWRPAPLMVHHITRQNVRPSHLAGWLQSCARIHCRTHHSDFN